MSLNHGSCAQIYFEINGLVIFNQESENNYRGQISTSALAAITKLFFFTVLGNPHAGVD